MNGKGERNKVMAKLTEIVETIRKHKRIRYGKLLVEMHLAPSTLYGYVRAIKDLFPDVRYEHGEFYVVEERHRRMPDAKEVRVER